MKKSLLLKQLLLLAAICIASVGHVATANAQTEAATSTAPAATAAPDPAATTVPESAASDVTTQSAPAPNAPAAWTDFETPPTATPLGVSGCVHNNSVATSSALWIRGNMTGCARGHLYLHGWLERNGARYPGPDSSNDCINSTGCSMPDTAFYSQPLPGHWVAVVHGWNTTTGGSNYVYEPLANVP